MDKFLKIREGLKSILVLMFFVIISYLIYRPTLHSAPLWDDWVFLFKSWTLQNISPWKFWVWGDYRRSWPLFYTIISYLRKLWGMETFNYHLVNLLIHSFNSFLIYRLLNKLKGNYSFLLALFFLVHPFQFYSVSWIIQIKTLLSIFFFLISLEYFINYEKHDSKWSYCISVLFFAASLMAKSVFSPILLLIIFYKDKKKMIPFALLCFYSIVLTIWSSHLKDNIKVNVSLVSRSFIAESVAEESRQIAEGKPVPVVIRPQERKTEFNNPTERAVLTLKNLTKYTFFVFYPWETLLVHPATQIHYDFYELGSSILIVFLFYILISFYIKSKNYLALAGVAFYLLTLLPFCGFFFIPIFHFSNFINYWLNVPVLGLILCASCIPKKTVMQYALLALIIISSYKILKVSRYSSNSVAMITNSIKESPKKTLIKLILARHYYFDKQYEKSIAVLTNAKKDLTLDSGKLDKDIEESRRALRGEKIEEFTL